MQLQWASGKSRYSSSVHKHRLELYHTRKAWVKTLVRPLPSLWGSQPRDQIVWMHRKKRFTSFPSPAGMSLTKLPLGRNNSVMTSLFPPRESLIVTSRLGTGNSRTFFYGEQPAPSLSSLELPTCSCLVLSELHRELCAQCTYILYLHIDCISLADRTAEWSNRKIVETGSWTN
jgi:hypothetical protein